MKRIYLFVVLYMGFAMCACSTMNPDRSIQTPIVKDKITKTVNPNKKVALRNPLNIKFYPKGLAKNQPYKIIAQESVSKFNHVGIKRQEAVIHDTLRKLAASVGGDAVINIKRDGQYVSGTIVSLEG